MFGLLNDKKKNLQKLISTRSETNCDHWQSKAFSQARKKKELLNVRVRLEKSSEILVAHGGSIKPQINYICG